MADKKDVGKRLTATVVHAERLAARNQRQHARLTGVADKMASSATAFLVDAEKRLQQEDTPELRMAYRRALVGRARAQRLAGSR